MLFSEIKPKYEKKPSILTLLRGCMIKFRLYLYSVVWGKKVWNVKKPLEVQFWHFWGSVWRNCIFTSTLCYLVKKIWKIKKKPLEVQFWHFRGRVWPDCIFTSTLCYWAKNIQDLKRTNRSSILTLLGESRTKLHITSTLWNMAKNQKCKKNP